MFPHNKRNYCNSLAQTNKLQGPFVHFNTPLLIFSQTLKKNDNENKYLCFVSLYYNEI